MTIQQVRKLYEDRPFRPFQLHLADGQTIRVIHPEWMSFSPSGRTVIVHRPDDWYDVVDLLLVTSVKVSPGRKAKTNGKS